jgi:hypothetical protein
MSKKCPTINPKYCGEWKGRGKNYPCIPRDADPCGVSKEVWENRRNMENKGFGSKKCGTGKMFDGDLCNVGQSVRPSRPPTPPRRPPTQPATPPRRPSTPRPSTQPATQPSTPRPSTPPASSPAIGNRNNLLRDAANGVAEFSWNGMKFIGTFVKGQIQSGSKTRRGFVWMFDKTKTGGRWVLVKGSELGDLSREGYLYSKKMYNAYREKKNKTKLSEKSKQLWKSEIMKQININKSSSVYYSANNRLSSYYTPNSSLKKSSSVYYSPTNRLSSYYTPNSSLKKSMSPRIRRTKRTKRRTNKKQKRNNKKTRRKPIRRRR